MKEVTEVCITCKLHGNETSVGWKAVIGGRQYGSTKWKHTGLDKLPEAMQEIEADMWKAIRRLSNVAE